MLFSLAPLLLALAPQASPSDAPALAVGDPAPAFAVERFLRGAPLEHLERGTVYLIEFWTVWCGPCVAGMPHLSELQRKYGDQGLCVIGVAPRPDEWGHDLASIEALLERKAPGYSIALDAENGASAGYQGVFRGRTIEGWMGAARVGAIPIAFVVDREGCVAAIDTPQTVEPVVRACLERTFDRAQAARRYRELLAARAQYEELVGLRRAGERAAARALGAELLEGALASDARSMLSFADLWLGKDAEGEDLVLGLRAAERGDELSQGLDPAILGLHAQALLRNGRGEEARRLAQRAVELAEGDFRAALEKDLAGVLAKSGAAGGAPQPALAQALDELVRVYADAGEFSGAVLVAKGDELLLRKAYGFADAERGIANTPETRFHVASLTKTFTSAAILLLAKEGKLGLADPVTRFLPDYPRGKEITVELLLGHRAGLPDHHGLPGFEELTRGSVSAAAMVDFVKPFPLDFEPGSQSRYSNSNYTLLARIIELVAGGSWADFLRARLIGPFSLAHTGPIPSSAAAPERARGHDPGPGERRMVPVPPRDWSYAVGTGSLESTVDDLLAWMRALDAREPVDLFALDWPYGWGRREGFGRRRIEQTGMHDGFTSVMAFYPDDDLFIVTLSNLLSMRSWNELQIGLAGIVLGADVPWPERDPPVALEREVARSLLGRYRHPNGFEFEVRLEDAGLYLVAPWGHQTVERYLDPLGPRRFRYRTEGAELVFPAERAGVDWIDGAGSQACSRVTSQ